jgi:hypothetical protein
LLGLARDCLGSRLGQNEKGISAGIRNQQKKLQVQKEMRENGPQKANPMILRHVMDRTSTMG